jgi:hypothetical protein
MPTQPYLSRAAANTIRRILDGELFYASVYSPRLRPKIRDELAAVGCPLQRSPGEQSPYYPQHPRQFIARACELGLITPESAAAKLARLTGGN